MRVGVHAARGGGGGGAPSAMWSNGWECTAYATTTTKSRLRFNCRNWDHLFGLSMPTSTTTKGVIGREDDQERDEMERMT